MWDPPDRDVIRTEIEGLTRQPAGAGNKHTLAARCPYMCGLDLVADRTRPGIPPGVTVVALLESALDRIALKDPQAAAALRAMLALGEGQTINPPRARDAKARELIGQTNPKTFVEYRPRLLDVMTDAFYDVVVSEEDLSLGLSATAALRSRQRELIDDERRHLRTFQHGLPKMTLRGAQLVPRVAKDAPEPPIAEVFRDWLQQPGSNLLVLLAGFGSGKTSSTLDLVESADLGQVDREPIYIRYRDVVKEISAGVELMTAVARHLMPDVEEREARRHLQSRLGDTVLIIDGFDATVLTSGRYSSAPDLSIVTPLISFDGKVIVTTDRAFSTSDELVRQVLGHNSSRVSLGIHDPVLVQLRACRSEDVVRVLAESTDGATARRLERYLHRLLRSGVEALRRPLFLHMLVDVAQRTLGDDTDEDGPEPLSLIELFDRYVEVALSRDWDRQTSNIPPDLKREVLRDIAYDQFQRRIGVLTVPVDESRVEARVMSVITQHRSELRVPPDHTFETYHWAPDFRVNNHLLTERKGSGSQHLDDAEVLFSSSLFHDYFVADAILGRLQKGRSIGIEEESFEPEAVSSLVLHFIKQRTNPAISAQVKRLLSDNGASTIDRMIMTYLLEDDPEILEVLRAAPRDYAGFLRRASFEYATVLARVVKYQQVLIESNVTDYSPALDFVDWATHSTGEQHKEPEGEMPAFREPIEDFLLGRLENPALAAAVPITIFRLGDFGGAASIGAIERVSAGLPEGAVSDLAAMTLDRIRARVGRTDEAGAEDHDG